ncbi:aminomethyl-transferring glycine dehydrogenase subunit GcvPA [Proteiniborus sp.]|uniref:aminomethyl-transferring glycine dehydrogenase subunit GcvPA n=1 Tax=Proteiniborus sp. TaxID=2079015 RepID=UPI003330E7B1
MSNKFSHPYIANSQPDVKKQMLDELGMTSVEDIFKEIPNHLRFKGQMDLPKPIKSEYALRKHVEGILAKNSNCKDNISFLGGGTWQHYVPSVCDTIASRDEFLTAYVGDAYSDHGKFQALFEFASMIGELVGMDCSGTPTYDWATSIGVSCRMASRKTGRKEIIVPENISPGRLAVVKNYLKPEVKVTKVKSIKETGLIDLNDLKSKLSDKIAAVYFENPTYLGVIETQGSEISKLVHNVNAEVIVGVDPSSLGVLEAPAEYGADIVCGEIQPLGIHMQWGGGIGGFIASRDEKEYVAEYPNLLYGLTTTTTEGEYGFGEVYYERTSYASREKAKDFVGTATALYGITAGVYLALMGPHGMKELGEGIMQRVNYAMKELSKIKGIKMAHSGFNFKEFVVDFNQTGKSVNEINEKLNEMGIFGGLNLEKSFPELGQSALYCITEIHTKEDIDKLISALKKILS